MICSSCKKTIPDNVQKCPYCGASVGTDTTLKVSTDTQAFAPVAGKKDLYKAADIDPERPVRRIDAERPEKPAHRRAPIVTAAIWILAAAILIAAVFCVCRLIARHSSGTNEVPDAVGIENNDLPADGADLSEADANPQKTPDPPAPPKPKPVYDIRGTWRWESETDGYRNTYWIFSTAGKLDIYLAGEAYDYVWPDTYEYDKDSYVLGLMDTAMGLAWLDEDTFACGSGKAYRIDTSEIPADAVNVRELEPAVPDSEEDPYLLPESDSRYLTAADLEGMDKQQLTLARNEIFARHGRLFSTPEIQEYFNSQSWYNGYIKPANFDSSVLNDYERYNVAFIGQYEDTLG